MMKYSVRWLKEKMNRGEEIDLLLFYGHAKKKVVSEECFSNWYECDFTVDGVLYHTSEQYMMAMKARVFGDKEVEAEIMAVTTPKEYKALGRKVRGFDPVTWNQHKTDIVKTGLYAKFSQNPELKEALLNTGDKILAESAPRDTVWGIGRGKSEAGYDPNQWRGSNLLGFCLMEVRDMLK